MAKHTFTRKLAAIALTGALSLTLLSGCVKNSYLVVGKQTVNMPVVMKVGRHNVAMEEYRYFYLNTKYQLDGGDDSVWEQEGADDKKELLRTHVEDTIKSNYALMDLAKEKGVSLTADERKSISDNLASIKENYESEEAFEEALAQNYLTEEVYLSMGEMSTLQQKLTEKLTGDGGEIPMGDDVVTQYVKDNYVRAKHVLITSATENAEQVANEVAQKAAAGEDFDSLISTYGEDPGMTQSPDGYYFTKNEMVAEFEEAAFALPENSVSGVVESSFGYHIIQRLPLDDAYIQENLSTYTSTYKTAKVYEQIEKVMDGYKVTYDKNYDLIDVDTVK